MTMHELKTWTKYFKRIEAGEKTFEVRINDRDFEKGDFLTLREWDEIKGEYTGRLLSVYVTYIIHGGQFGIEEGYCVMGIKIDNP